MRKKCLKSVKNMKKCKCGTEFIQYTTMQNCCIECLAEKVAKNRVRTEKSALQTKKRELKADKDRIKSRATWIKEVQQAVNAYIRARDKGKPCISCAKATKPGDHAGHWKPTSTSPELRFSESNIHLQCVQCNLYLHGNVAQYRLGLMGRIGIELVEWLESKHPPAKWTIDELKELKKVYKNKLKEIT